MNENEIVNDMEEVVELDELTTLKQRADVLGIKYHHNVGVDKLRKQIKAAVEGEEETKTTKATDTPTEEETPQQKRMRLRNEALKLVRVNVHTKDPMKKDWPGEIITVSNANVDVKKYVQFDTPNGYHLPKIILDVLKDKQIQLFRTKKGPNGIDIREAYLTSAYTIEELPPLTPKELEELARDQRSRNAID